MTGYVHYPANQRRRKFLVTLKDGTHMTVTAHDEADARQLVNGTRVAERAGGAVKVEKRKRGKS